MILIGSEALSDDLTVLEELVALDLGEWYGYLTLGKAGEVAVLLYILRGSENEAHSVILLRHCGTLVVALGVWQSPLTRG